MGRFIVTGVLVEEPKIGTTSSGIDTLSILVEEKYSTPSKREVINVYSIDYIGKGVNCVPAGVRLIGCPVVVTGSIRSREYKGKYYNDLQGETFSVIDVNSLLDKMPQPVASNLEVIDLPQEEVEEDEKVELPDDDLPF